MKRLSVLFLVASDNCETNCADEQFFQKAKLKLHKTWFSTMKDILVVIDDSIFFEILLRTDGGDGQQFLISILCHKNYK